MAFWLVFTGPSIDDILGFVPTVMFTVPGSELQPEMAATTVYVPELANEIPGTSGF